MNAGWLGWFVVASLALVDVACLVFIGIAWRECRRARASRDEQG